jgi:hypothetical protein
VPHVSALTSGLPAGDIAIVLLVVSARVGIPLLIPSFPLAILAALVLDAADQTIFQLWTDVNTSETGIYQSYDKALDVYYLAIAYTATMRNWTSNPAFRIAQFLFIYRLVGTTLFELTDQRWLLMVFPNTFEYFFIAYELLRTRDPAAVSARAWALWAAFIWVFIKLPQEWWIHIAQLDFTEAVQDHTWFGVAVVVGLLTLAAVLVFVVRPRRKPPDFPFRLAADPLPPATERAAERRARLLRSGRVFTLQLLEKVTIIALLSVIFAQFLPSVDATPLQVTLAVAVFVTVDTVVSLWAARHGRLIVSTGRAFAALLVMNTALALVYSWVTRGPGEGLSPGNTLFFVYLLTLVVVLYDRYRPIYEARFAPDGGTPPGPRAVWREIRLGRAAA